MLVLLVCVCVIYTDVFKSLSGNFKSKVQKQGFHFASKAMHRIRCMTLNYVRLDTCYLILFILSSDCYPALVFFFNI